MADDNPAINSGISPPILPFMIFRDQCQDRLARFTMLPPDYARYTQLTGNYVSGVLPYAEFYGQMFDLLEQNPNYVHVRVYWVDYDRFMTQGIPLMDSPLFTHPVIRHANMGISIPPDNVAQFVDLLSASCTEQSKVPFAEHVRDRQLALVAYQQEVDRIEEWSRRQDPLAGTPDPVVTDENLLFVTGENLLFGLNCCLTIVARFTMRPVHYEEYNEIVRNFDARNIPYEEFRFQMVALLQQNSNYAHLGVFWDVFDRVIIGEEQMLQDNPLFLYPVALYVLLNLFLYSAQIRDPLWNVEPERVLASQRELSRIRSRRYRMAGGDAIRALDPHINPEWNLVFLLDCFQEWEAKIVMGSEDYDCYARLTYNQCHGLMPHDKFMEEMGALLQSPHYQILRLWWHIHRMDVCGVRRMVDNPFLRFPLAFWVTLHIVLYFAICGDGLWNHFLNTVRQHRR